MKFVSNYIFVVEGGWVGGWGQTWNKAQGFENLKVSGSQFVGVLLQLQIFKKSVKNPAT